MRIKIGLLFSLTGTTSITEKGQCDAARFATWEYNRGPCKIEAVVRDICSDPQKAAREAEALAQKGIRIFVGCYTSACRKAILPVLEAYNCLLVYPTLYEGRESHPHVIYTGELPNQQIHTLLEYMTRQYGKRVYCIGTDYLYPRETNRQVHTFLNERSGAVVKEHYVPFGHQHFQDILADIIAQEPDAIFSTLVGKSIVSFYRDFHRLGLYRKRLPIFSPITKETELAEIEEEYRAGHYSSASYFQSLPSDENKAFIKGFQRFMGKELPISSVMFNTYLGTKMVLDSLLEAKSINHQKIIERIGGRTFSTACGTMTVDVSHRHLSRPVKIGKSMANGQFEIVWDSSRSISPNPYLSNPESAHSPHEAILQEWGQISDEALIVLSAEGIVMYMSQQASKLTELRMGQTITSEKANSFYRSFDVTRHEKPPYLFYLLKPKWDAPPCLAETSVRFGRVMTVQSAYKDELKVAQLAAQSQANVLILGETGTGKEVLAESIHRESDQRHGPFVAVNTATLPRDLIASELFGFVDGAFTGARKGGAIGKFEAAHDGTIFLDEIGDMPLDLQVALLRVIESKKIVRLGDTKERPVNVRIIAATNRNLEEAVSLGETFRSDLFYRLNVLSLTIPPLRERIEDIEHLSRQFLHEFRSAYEHGPLAIEKNAWQAMTAYSWPGNIRELRNVLERAFLLARSEHTNIRLEHLPRQLRHDQRQQASAPISLKNLERQVIEQTLQKTRSVGEAAQLLGIARSTLYRKIKELQLLSYSDD
ncbi:transporter substrate-binding protein [Brevibacillus borstelensis]|uniref:transporter substrate-binding protein n=1 Tax=Brevibacillus borstelensis TaxID=45462 RepID=UPI0030BC31EC